MADGPFQPPQNIEAEVSILGAILIDDEAIYKVADYLKADDFYDPKNRTIYSAIIALFDDSEAIDAVTLSSYLKKTKQIAKSGGAGYITELVEKVSSAANIADYSKLVKEAATRRRLISLSGKITDLAMLESEALSDVINSVESEVFSLTQNNIDTSFVHVRELLAESFEKTDELHSDPNKIRGIPSGFKKLDTLLGGFNKSDLIILAARPSVGKSAFAIDVARHVAVEEGKSVGIFSLEMSNIQIMDRILSMQLNTSLFGLRTGKVSDQVFKQFSSAADKLARSKLYVDDTPGQSIVDIRTKARKLKLESGLDFLVIDYLQLIEGSRKENRVQEVSDISRKLKILARELDVTVLAAAQLSRAVEQRSDKRPQLSDLRESGSIEQDADIVMFLQREGQFDPEADRDAGNLFVAKHRNGPTGNVELRWVEKQARYRDSI